MVAVRCPSDFEPFMRQAGGLWDPGGRHWLVERPAGARAATGDRSAVPPGRSEPGRGLTGEGTAGSAEANSAARVGCQQRVRQLGVDELRHTYSSAARISHLQSGWIIAQARKAHVSGVAEQAPPKRGHTRS